MIAIFAGILGLWIGAVASRLDGPCPDLQFAIISALVLLSAAAAMAESR